MAVSYGDPLNQEPVIGIGRITYLGSLAAANDALKFVLPSTGPSPGHGIAIQAVSDGTVTTLTTELDASLDGKSNYSKVGNGPAAAPGLAQVDTKGLAGVPMQLLASALTLGTGTKVDIYVSYE